jgi:hypothetical protein
MQEDQEFKASVGYIAPVSKNQQLGTQLQW